jgi:ribokinase
MGYIDTSTSEIKKPHKILCFGTIAIDTITPYFAENLSERFNADAKPPETMLGGQAANFAVAVSRQQNCSATIISVVGNDKAGQWAIDRLQENSVNVSLIQKVPAPSLQMQIDLTPPLSVHCLSRDHASKYLKADVVSEEFLSSFDLGLAHATHAWEELLSFMDKSVAANLKVIFNPAPLVLMKDMSPIEKASLIIANETEASEICNKLGVTNYNFYDIAYVLQQKTGRDFIVTLGENGCVAAIGNENWKAPARNISAIDTTGAGDTFLGVFAATYLRHISTSECLRIANTAASIVCGRYGAAESVPTLKDILSVLQETPEPIKYTPCKTQKSKKSSLKKDL